MSPREPDCLHALVMDSPSANQTTALQGPLHVLLGGAIDYAGLFPPAVLPMEQAVANYAEYRKGPFAWMLGRFVIPAAGLRSFREAINALAVARHPEEPWRVSLIADREMDPEAVSAFNSKMLNRRPGTVIDSIEVKTQNPEEIQAASRIVPPGSACYFELPQGSALEGCVEAVRESRCCAKVRCGGVRAEQFISSENLARFIHLCLGAGVPFKATAGLHHPMRGRYPLTLDASGPAAVMHGFLNLLMAIVFAQGGMGEAKTVELLQDESSESFCLAHGGASWRNHHAGEEQLSRARRFIHSFGSCSFTDPVRDVRALKLI